MLLSIGQNETDRMLKAREFSHVVRLYAVIKRKRIHDLYSKFGHPLSIIPKLIGR